MPSEVECVCCAPKNSFFFVKAGGRFVTLHLIIFKSHFLIFYIDGEPGTMKVHDTYTRLAWWQSLAFLLPNLVDRFTDYLIRINCAILL